MVQASNNIPKKTPRSILVIQGLQHVMYVGTDGRLTLPPRTTKAKITKFSNLNPKEQQLRLREIYFPKQYYTHTHTNYICILRYPMYFLKILTCKKSLNSVG